MRLKNVFKIEIDTNRIFGLDILRAFAILFVLIEHGGYLLYGRLAGWSSHFIFDGVTIFFVLSGYLIGNILIKSFEKTPQNAKLLLSFWIRRWFRTLPNYFLILIILCIVHYFFDVDFQLKDARLYFVFLQNFNHSMSKFFFPESWSLAVEEWFYLITPILILFIIKIFRTPTRLSILFSIILVVAFSFIVRYIKYIHLQSDDNTREIFRKEVVVRLDSLIIGVFGAFCSYYYNVFWSQFKRTLFFLGLLLLGLSNYGFLNIIFAGNFYKCICSYFIVSLSVLCMLPYLSSIKSGKGILYKYITCVSMISYSMYLLNESIIQTMLSQIDLARYSSNLYLISIIKYVAFWIILLPVSMLLYKYYEMPFMKLREKFKA